MKVLVTGANGFVGHYLCKHLLQNGHLVTATGKGHCRQPYAESREFTYRELDFTNAVTVDAVLVTEKPQVIIHAAAMSRPNDCELDKEQAYLVNVKGTENLLKASAKYNCFFIFLSTDFIFDGKTGMYKEDDEPGPVNYYGKTKLLAEVLVKQYPHHWSIVRTVLVYGPPMSGRPNLLSIVKEKLEKGETYSVVEDQLRTPTYVEDLASALVLISEKKVTGIFHISGNDVITPYQMAAKAAEYLRLDTSLLKKVTADNFKEAALRPLKTGFVTEKARRMLGYKPVSFQEGLQKTFS